MMRLLHSLLCCLRWHQSYPTLRVCRWCGAGLAAVPNWHDDDPENGG